MKSRIKSQTIVVAAELIYNHRQELFKNNKLDKTVLKALTTVSKFFDVSNQMAAVLSVIIYDQLLGDGTNFKRILRELGITPVEAINVYKEAKELRIKGWLQEVKSRLSRFKDQFELSKDALTAVMENNPAGLKPKNFETQEDALMAMLKLFHQHSMDENIHEQLDLLIHQLNYYVHFPVFKKVLTDSNLTIQEQLVILWMASEFVTHRTEIMSLSWIVEKVFQNPYWLLKIQKRLTAQGYLIEQRYIGFSEPGLTDTDSITLGDAITELIDASLASDVKKEPLFKFCEPIYPNSINEVDLFFNESNLRQIEEIKSLLSISAYERIVERFKAEGMPTGLAILLSGLPGTGKTETVKQMAKAHERMILMVDISKFKSMWLGETEKNIKRIFIEYQMACDYYDVSPILFFNEADAILGKRNKVNSNIDQTMNNIQNILLQQMEDFKGILIATTNLADHLDKAFDRRFVIKCEFEEPNNFTRAKIIKKQLPEISEELAEYIAANYALTGGQIQNVKRRIIAKRVLKGDFIIDKTELESLVLDEVKVKAGSAIGFTLNGK